MTDLMPKIDIRPDHWEIVSRILQKHVPQHEVWAFGSRAKWTAKEYSDLDLAVITDKPLSLDVSASLSDDFSESELPYKVDVVDWATTGESFRRIIERDKVVVKHEVVSCGEIIKWPTKPLINCTLDGSISYGIVQPGQHADDGIPIIRVNNFRNGTLDTADVLRVSVSIEDGYRRTRLQGGEVLLTLVGSVGQTAIVSDDLAGWNVARAIAVIRPSTEVSAKWLAICLQSAEARHFLDGRANTTVQKTLNLSDVKQVPIPIPPKGIRVQLESVISSLDDKIDLNRRINQTLETMAQAIFKSWFVDFEPVKAKIAALAEGRDPLRAAMSAISGKPEEELDALPTEGFEQLAATAALFPDEMEESELGEIPKGWKVRTMPECIDVNPARTVRKGAIAKYLDMANVPTNSARVQNLVLREFTSGSKFKNGDTLLARITPCLENGKTAFVDFLNGDEVGWGSTEFIVLRPKIGLPAQFAYFLCRHPDFRAFAIAQMAGTSGRQRVPNDCFGGYKLVGPIESVAIDFGRIASAALDQIKALDEEAKTLATLRDTLLPKLLSGELSVNALSEEAPHAL